MSVQTMCDLSKFGKFEIDEAIKLLQAYRDKVPDGFYEDDVKLCSNSFSGCVFLTNSDMQTLMMNGDSIEIFYSTPYDFHEGFADELKVEFEADPDGWESEDVEYLHDHGILTDEEWEAYEKSEESEIELTAKNINVGANREVFTFTVNKEWLESFLTGDLKDYDNLYKFLNEYNVIQTFFIYETALADEDSELYTDYEPSGE